MIDITAIDQKISDVEAQIKTAEQNLDAHQFIKLRNEAQQLSDVAQGLRESKKVLLDKRNKLIELDSEINNLDSQKTDKAQAITNIQASV